MPLSPAAKDALDGRSNLLRRILDTVIAYERGAFADSDACASQGRVNAVRKVLDNRHPLGHVGEPDDIAWGIVYLASDEAKFVTGTELVIDGGYTAR